MNVNITAEYFAHLETIYNEAKADPLSARMANIRAVFNLSASLPLITDVPLEKIEALAKAETATRNSSLESILLKLAWKQQRLQLKKIIFNQQQGHSAYYFSHDRDVNEIASNYGVAGKGTEFDGGDFYQSCTVNDLVIREGWDEIRDCIPPANAMFIVDKYILSPFSKKIQLLLEFVRMYKAEIRTPFHLTILFSNESKGKELTSKAEIDKAFDLIVGLGSVECQLILDNKLPESDRLVFTNYTSGNIGHPFDGRKTKFNQNFLGYENDSDAIKRNYKQFREELEYWYEFIDKMPAKIGLVQTRWQSSEFTNRLFDFVSG